MLLDVVSFVWSEVWKPPWLSTFIQPFQFVAIQVALDRKSQQFGTRVLKECNMPTTWRTTHAATRYIFSPNSDQGTGFMETLAKICSGTQWLVGICCLAARSSEIHPKHAAWGWLVGGISRNHPKLNFSIFLNKLVCRINSTMNVFLSMQFFTTDGIVEGDFTCVLSSQPPDFTTGRWARHRCWNPLVWEGWWRSQASVTWQKGMRLWDGYGADLMGVDTSWMIFYMKIFFSYTNPNEAWLSSFYQFAEKSVRCYIGGILKYV